MSPLLLVLGAFVAMEGVSYATHRWVMHGFALAWHRSHHAPATSRFERNDLFPLMLLVGRDPAVRRSPAAAGRCSGGSASA